MLVSLTVGKVDAGVAVLLTEDKRLIEFPSILLPPDISSGSIVDITVARNFVKEDSAQRSFARLQSDIYNTFGTQSPSPPVLRCRNATQTSIVLEWDPIQLATAELRSLSLYRNGSKAGSIPRPLEQHSTKISGLPLDEEYTFHLVLRTSAGTYSSDKLVVRTHKMTDLSGITITPGIMAAPLRESLEKTVERIGAKLIDTVRIDTTHFVCTEGRGQQWERAVEMNVPVVVPDWIKGCEREGRLVGVRGYYLNADPRLRQVGQGVAVQQQAHEESQQLQQSPLPQQQPLQPHSPERATPRTEVIPPTPEQGRDEQRTANGDDKPPPPPPKLDERDEEAEPKTPIGAEDKARTEDLKASSAPRDEKSTDDESEEDGDEGDEKAIEAGAKHDGSVGGDLPVRGKPFADEDPPEEADAGDMEEVEL
ncbi:MAG: Chitin synthase, class 5 [Bogoriella megaspora]|nr:MAG: Chitin synthase, class 5 [Bogoriella megaspora]